MSTVSAEALSIAGSNAVWSIAGAESTWFEQWLSVSGTIETIDVGGSSATAACGCILCPGSRQVWLRGRIAPLRPGQAMSTDEWSREASRNDRSRQIRTAVL